MGKKGTKRKTRWRILPIGGEDGCNGVCSNNEDEADGDRDSASPLNSSSTISTSYARASSQQRMPRPKPTTPSSRGGSYNYRHRSYCQPHDINQPLVTTEKKMFNEEEYTKITTPRQDVLFKKGYLGRKRPTVAPTADSTANVNSSSSINPDNTAADIANGNYNVNGTAEQGEEPIEIDQITNSDMMSPMEEQPQYIYATNGYVDQTGGPPPPVYYINGSGYELYDPYSGNVTVVVGPAPHFGGPGGAPPVLAAVPCQPLPLQPFEWFNPTFLPYVTAPCHNGLVSARDRRKRYSTDSQNCSPQSSESTEPPGSPQECEMEVTHTGEPPAPAPALYTQAPAYVYPGYMFGPPMYNVNGVTVQGAPTQLPVCDITGSNKRRKKKKKRKRRRGGAEDGCSEESSSDEKDLEDPVSLTSQESSSQEIESDSKQSITPNNDSSTSPLSSCQTVTPTDPADYTTRKPTALCEHSPQLNEFDSDIPPLVNVEQSSLGEQESVSAPSALEQDVKGTTSDDKCDPKSVLQGGGKKSIQELSQQSVQVTKDRCEDLNSVQCLKDQVRTEEVDLPSSVCKSALNSVQQKEFLQLSADCQDTPCVIASSHSADNSKFEKASESNGLHSSLTRLHSSESTNQETEIDVQFNSECIIKNEDSTKPIKHKKSGKQANVKHKKSPKGKEEKQKRLKTTISSCSVDTNLERRCKKKGDIREGTDNNEIVIDSAASTLHSSVNSIPSENITETEIFTVTGDSASSQKNITEDTFTVLNSLGDGFHISEPEVESNSLVGMDGSEDKSASATNEQVSSEEFVNSGRSSHTNRTGKHDLFPEFKSCCEDPPVRPQRKEKLKSSPVHSLSEDEIPSEVSTKSSITAKPLKLPTVSLRPDIPKIEPKCKQEMSSSQLKDSADILDSITAALTTDPPLAKLPQATVHKDKTVVQEAAYTAKALQSSESSVVQEGQTSTASSPHIVQGPCSKAGEKLFDLQKGISYQAIAVSVEHEADTNRKEYSFEKLHSSTSTSSRTGNEDTNDIKNKMVFKDHVSEELTQSKKFKDEFEPPIPPPRTKKLHGCKHILTEHSQVQGWDLEGGNTTDESSGDSTTSSTTRESEESVIELLSSTHTNPDDRLKQGLSSDEEEEIIFRAKVAHRISEMVDIKSVPPDKPNVCLPSISGPCLQNSKHISYEDKPTKSRTFPKSQRGDVSLQYAELYADELSKIIVSEAVSESSKKRMCLPITEAVTRWLRSQSPDVLALPQPEDGIESESSSGEQESDESMADVTGNQQSTGQKNVFCNPLPVPLLEDHHWLLVNTDANHVGDCNGSGRRVALNDCQYFKLQNGNFVSENYDNNRTNVAVSIEGDKRLISGYDDGSFIISQKRNCDSVTPIENSDPEKHKCLCQVTKSHEGENVLTGFSWNVTPNVNCKNQHGICSGNVSEVTPMQLNHINSGMNTARNNLQKEITLTNVQENSFQNISQDKYKIFKSSSEPVNLDTNNIDQGKCTAGDNGFYGKHPENVNEKEYSFSNYKSDLIKEEEGSSYTSEGTLECEWDLWDCNPVKILPVLTTPKSQTPVEETLSETPDDYCSRMCDATVSVAKYYSLGALQKKSVKFDDDGISNDATDSSDEEVDALKHFQHELEDDDDDGLQIAHLPSNGTGNPHKMSGEGPKRNVTYGNPDIYKAHYGESGELRNLGVKFQEEADRCRNMYNTTLSQRAQAAHLFHRKSSVLVSKLKGDGPFPCGGICCILQ